MKKTINSSEAHKRWRIYYHWRKKAYLKDLLLLKITSIELLGTDWGRFQLQRIVYLTAWRWPPLYTIKLKLHISNFCLSIRFEFIRSMSRFLFIQKYSFYETFHFFVRSSCFERSLLTELLQLRLQIEKDDSKQLLYPHGLNILGSEPQLEVRSKFTELYRGWLCKNWSIVIM